MRLREPRNLATFGRSDHLGGALAALAAILLLASPATPLPSADPAGCTVWVVRNALASPAAWRSARTAVERTGCRRVFLQVSGRWDAYFASVVHPSPESAPHGESWSDDPFGRAAADARSRGLEVHAWVNAMLAWSAPNPPENPRHVFHSRPEWFVTGRDGRSMRSLSRGDLDALGLVGEGWFLDPARVEVRTELRRFVLEIATRYPIDGIHLDYIRYPAGWATTEGTDAVTRLVALIRSDLRAVEPGLALSAAVMPRPEEALRSFGQDWASWLARDLVDEAVPMVYRNGEEAVMAVVERYPDDLPRDRIRIGVRIDRLSPRETRSLVRRAEAGGYAGLALFSQNLLLEDSRWRGAGAVSDP